MKKASKWNFTNHRGNYDTFENTRAERAKHAARAQEKVELQKQHMQSFTDKFRYNAKRASLVQSRIKVIGGKNSIQPLIIIVVYVHYLGVICSV